MQETAEDLKAAAAEATRRREFALAGSLLTRAAALRPSDPALQADLAAVLRMAGDLDGAARAAVEALRLEPWQALAFQILADVGSLQELRRVLPVIEAATSDGAPADRQATLRYAAGQARHRLGEPDAAMAHWRAGAELSRRGRTFDVARNVAVIDALIGAHRLPRLRVDGALQSAQTVFVTGLPRSGTTLVEQLLLRGGEMSSIGERSTLQDAIGVQLRAEGRGASDPAGAALASAAADTPAIGRRYLRDVRAGLGISGAFIDKTPTNALFTGVIASGFPFARTVLLTRDAPDLLLAIFRTNFNGLYPFALDLADLAIYIAAFRRLVGHWAQVLPADRFLLVPYEQLARNPETIGEALHRFAELTWRPQVLDPASRTVAADSASAGQVRQPVDATRIGTWRAYERWLAPYLEILAD